MTTEATYQIRTADFTAYAHRPTIAGALTRCPRCNVHAMDMSEVHALFGLRRMKRGIKADGSYRIEVRVQSHCRECRREERKARRAAMKK